ncbi:hypothetical protein TNCV_644231 [Trichonephila clavipes]|nr:hypothetical protein TNCV_644231 [Trichonephila clavipes]
MLILLYLGTAAVAFPARPRHDLLAIDLVTWQAMVGRHILEDIVGRVAHTETEGLKKTRLQFAKLPEVKNPVDTAYDVGSVVSVLADVGSSSQLRSVVSLMVSLDGTGCLEGGKWR